MATILCTIDKSNWYEMYIEYSVSQNPVTAQSTINHALKLKQLTNGYDFAGKMTVTYKIGNDTFSFSDMVDIDDVGDAGYTIAILSGTSVIQHDTTTGAGSFYVECSGACNSAGYGPGNISISGQNIALPTIDRTAPSVSVSVQSITTNSAIVTATSNVVSERWDYSIDGGVTWIAKVLSSGTSIMSFNLQGLSPYTDYNIIVRVRRPYNQVFGTTSASFKTLGCTVLNSVNTLSIDVMNPVLTMNWTVYTNYTHTLSIKDGETTVLVIENITGSIGTINKTIALTDVEQSAILAHMIDRQSFAATFCLTSFDSNGVQVGDYSVKTATIQTTAANSAPMFESFEHRDSDINGTVEITGDDSVYIKGYSSLEIEIKKAGAKYHATIASYKVTVGADTKVFDTPVIDYGTIGVSGDNISLIVEVVDSRGYSTAITKNIVVLDYADVSITDYSIRRKNEVEATVQLAFSGDYCPIKIDGESNNGITSAQFRYAPSGGNWSDWVDAVVTENSDTFEFVTIALSNNGTPIEFDPNSQYTIDIIVADRLSDDTLTIVLNKGTPLVAYRSKKVGINTPDPQAALHVTGEGDLLKLNDLTIEQLILEKTYPVGSIYISLNSVSPDVLFGGEWEQIENRFLLACGSDYEAGSVGGEATHKLTENEMPTHAHGLTQQYSYAVGTASATQGYIDGLSSYNTASAGGGQPHNNMPPYLAVYIWKRIK